MYGEIHSDPYWYQALTAALVDEWLLMTSGDY